MKYSLTCCRCRKSWRYQGAAPWESLAEHRAREHADEVLGPSPLDVDTIADTGENLAPAEVALPAEAHP